MPKRATAGEKAARAPSQRNHASKPEPPTRVLCYSPYTMWEVHGLWETTILHALKLRGAEVRYVLCDGLYSECDVCWAATAPRSTRSCIDCQARVSSLMQRMVMPYQWLGRYLLPGELAEAESWAAGLAREALEDAAYDEWQIASWVRSSVHSHLRASKLDLSDARIERAYRNYLSSGLTAAFAVTRLLDDFRPDVMLQFNGRQSSTRIALELARARDIKVVCHERGAHRGSISLTENVNCASLAPLRKTWDEWQGIPLDRAELERAHDYLLERQHGVNQNWRIFSPPPQEVAEVRSALTLDPGRRLWVLFTSSDDEVAAEGDWQGPIANQLEWIDRTVAFAASHPEIDLVIRAHPNSGGRKSTGRNEGLLHAFEELAERLPANARLVRPDDRISTYTLMDICDLGLVWHSGVAFELAMKGKRAVIGAGSMVRGYEFVHDVEDAEGYEGQLESLLEAGPLPAELQRLAYRWVYAAFFRRDVPFPLVELPDPQNGRIAYSSTDDLLPGRDASLDRVCRILLESEPVASAPGEAELARSEADEEEFFGHPHERDPLVSVVIPCHNYGRFLGEAVESILAQSLQNFELIVVDDGSEDDSRALAEALIEANPERAIRLIAQPPSGQPAIARNNGIAEARGRFVCCLDADDRLGPSWLESCVAALEADPSLGFAYGDQQNFGDDKSFEPHPPYDFEMLKRFNFVPTAAVFTRAGWKKSGGYLTNVRGYEDWNFWLSLAAAGLHGRRVENAVWFYRKHGTSLYAEQVGADHRLKAQTVINHERLYGRKQLEWARAVLADDPGAVVAPTGVVPVWPDDDEIEQPLHVCFFMYGWAEEGGGTLFPRQLSKGLVARGHKVSVIYAGARPLPGKPPYWVEHSEEDGIALYGIFNRPALFYDPKHPERDIDDPGARAVVNELLGRLQPDVIHYHSLLGFSMEATADADRAGIASVFTSHNYWPVCPKMYLFHDDLSLCDGPSAKACASCTGAYASSASFTARAETGRRILSRHVDRHLAVSTRVRDIYVRNGHDPERIRVLHQNSELGDRLWDELGSRRTASDRGDRPLRVGFIGTLLAHKGAHVLAAALQAFEPGEIEGHLFGRTPDQYRNMLEGIDRKGMLRFHGAYEPEQLKALLESVDFVCVPSVWEDCAPLVVAEALAAGCPVVGSRIGGIPDFIREGTDGLLFEPNDPSSLASALRRLLDEPQLLESFQTGIAPPSGAAAYVDELVNHYREVIVERGARKEQIEGTRTFAALAFADELIGDSTLLAEYGRVFSGADDATLIIYGEIPHDALLEAVAKAGLDADDAADLLALSGAVGSAAEKRLARGVDALLSRLPRNGSFAGLPLCDRVEALRELAEHSWAG